jgi:hypothetical protein
MTMHIAIVLLLVVSTGALAIPADTWPGPGWYVVTVEGQHLLGPFATQDDCQAWATTLARLLRGVSPVCQFARVFLAGR